MIRRLPTALTLVASLVLALAGSAVAHSRIHYLHPEAVRIHKASGPRPSISRVSPTQVKVGQKLVVYGKNFRKGAGKNKVFFEKRDGGIVIAKAQIGTTTKLVVKVPGGVNDLLDLKGKTPVATKIQLRVLTGRFSSTTKLSKSPLILPKSGSGPTGGPACLQATTADSDGDGLTNTLEITKLHTDPCHADTDGDGVSDGYEYQSALDINNTTLTGQDTQASNPCACKVPYPNPLDPTDANIDHDGDGLAMALEYKFNKYVHGPKVGALQYSDGKQRSQDVPAPADPVFAYVDHITYPATLNKGWLSDDERDADNDGLTNWDECCGRMTQDWWKVKYDGSNLYPKETPYGQVDGSTVVAADFAQVDPLNPDTDGDAIPDGLDDQDHDGLTNRFEVSRPWDWFFTYKSAAHDGVIDPALKQANGGPIPDGATGQNPWARVNPYNPCKPVFSKTCHIYIPFGYYPPGEDIAGVDPETIAAPPAAPWLFDANDYPTVDGGATRSGANGE